MYINPRKSIVKGEADYLAKVEKMKELIKQIYDISPEIAVKRLADQLLLIVEGNSKRS